MYRHALPPGFVLKKDKKKEETEEEISLEELIENEVRIGCSDIKDDACDLSGDVIKKQKQSTSDLWRLF